MSKWKEVDCSAEVPRWPSGPEKAACLLPIMIAARESSNPGAPFSDPRVQQKINELRGDIGPADYDEWIAWATR